MSGMFGGGKNKEMLELQRQQLAMVRQEQAKVDAIAAGQRKVREGGRGGMAFIDDAVDIVAGAANDNSFSALFGQGRGRRLLGG